MRRAHDGTFAQSAQSRVRDAAPGGLEAEDIASPNSDEGDYSGPFGHCQYEMPRDFMTDEERRKAFGPACIIC